MNSARKTRQRQKQHKPRNPLIAPVMQRKAGSHRKSRKSERQAGRQHVEQTLRER